MDHAPPSEVPYNVAGGTAQTIGLFIVVCLILIYSVRVYRKTKDTMPLLIAIPSWIVVNGDYPWLISQAAGLFTIFLGVVTIGMEIRLFTKQEPFPSLKK